VGAADPVGVYDSGVGGLSVLREIRRELPGETLIYAADSGNAPYGDRPPDFIHARAAAVTGFLVSRGVKAVVVACNTVTGVAVEALRRRFTLPIVAIEPAVKPASARTKTGVVGVLATSVTLSSANLLRLVGQYRPPGGVAMQACPGLVEQVEKGDLDGPETRALVERYVQPLLAAGADTIVLGCTHYAFLAPLVEAVAGSSVAVIDPAPAVARELRRRLTTSSLLAQGARPASVRFFSSSPPDRAAAVISQLWGERVAVERF
jgi:glutamate racemase